MEQLTLAPRPGMTRDQLEHRVADVALETLAALGGKWIRQRDLADRCFATIGIYCYSRGTMGRRLKSAIRILRVERRKLVSSGPRGYALSIASAPDIRRQVAEIRTRGETIRAVDPALADALTPFFAFAERYGA